MANGNDRPLTSADIAEATGFSEWYISRKLDKAGIDLTSVRAIADGRIIAKTQGGANRILYGVDSGPNGRTIYWGSYGGVRRLLTQTADYPELEEHGAVVYYPRLGV